MKKLSIEEEELLFKDLSSRLLYKVTCKCYHVESQEQDGKPFVATYDETLQMMDADGLVFTDGFNYEIDEVRPYLRSLSSMTEEEKIRLYQIAGFYYLSDFELQKDEWKKFSDALSENKLFLPYPTGDNLIKIYDWLNKHDFDYRGLIEKGLAIEITEDNNPYK